MNEGLLKILDAQDWDDVIIKLTAYVVQYCKWKKYWLPKGLEAEDIALSAIEKIYTGERSWDMEKEPNLQNHLQSVTNSIIINEIRSGAAGEKRIETIPEDYHAVSNGVEEELYCKQLDQEIATSMRGDPMVCLVYKALKDGLPPREIAEEYSVDILQIRLAQKRLRRLAERVIDQLSKVNYHE